MSKTMAEAIQAIILVRDKRDELKRAWEAEDKKLEQAQEKIETWIQKRFIEQGETSSKTAHGTAYQTKTLRASAADWPAFTKWVRENDRFDLLTKRISTKELGEILKDNPDAVVPGVSYSYQTAINVRKPT